MAGNANIKIKSERFGADPNYITVNRRLKRVNQELQLSVFTPDDTILTLWVIWKHHGKFQPPAEPVPC